MSSVYGFPARAGRPGTIGQHSAFLKAGSVSERGFFGGVMITSAENRHRADDHGIGANYREVGLPVASIIRPTKIATIEGGDASRIGQIPRNLLRGVLETISRTLAL